MKRACTALIDRMGKSVQIRDLDEGVYKVLAERAASDEMSVPEFIRREIHRIAARPALDAWLDGTRRRSVPHDRLITEAAPDELRGG